MHSGSVVSEWTCDSEAPTSRAGSEWNLFRTGFRVPSIFGVTQFQVGNLGKGWNTATASFSFQMGTPPRSAKRFFGTPVVASNGFLFHEEYGYPQRPAALPEPPVAPSSTGHASPMATSRGVRSMIHQGTISRYPPPSKRHCRSERRASSPRPVLVFFVIAKWL